MKHLIVLLFLTLTSCGSVSSETECRVNDGQVITDENGDYAGCIEAPSE
jgi:hypothetical protein